MFKALLLLNAGVSMVTVHRSTTTTPSSIAPPIIMTPHQQQQQQQKLTTITTIILATTSRIESDIRRSRYKFTNRTCRPTLLPNRKWASDPCYMRTFAKPPMVEKPIPTTRLLWWIRPTINPWVPGHYDKSMIKDDIIPLPARGNPIRYDIRYPI